MKTLINICVLLVSSVALASPSDPAMYQYWFDNDHQSRINNTRPYDASSNTLALNAGNLSEGGHAFHYRMAYQEGGKVKWGPTFTKYFHIPSASSVALASPSDPTMYQYWFDNDHQSRINNTRPYDASLNTFILEAENLSEGGHAFHYRMAYQDGDKVMWGTTVTKYFHIPSVPDASNSVPRKYRLFINTDKVAEDVVPDPSYFTLTADLLKNDIKLSSVIDRSFAFMMGENKVRMKANGMFSYAVQLMSDQKEWGSPLYKEISHEVITKLPVDLISVPERYEFKKVDNNNFKAYRFKNHYSDYLYITPSQDCKVSLYYIYEGYDSNLASLETSQLTKGQTNKVYTGGIGTDVIAIFYDTPKDKDNSEDDVKLDIMLEDNKMPKPLIDIDLDTWEVTISCPDPRASIFYTLDNSHPTTSSTFYTGPIVLDKITKVRAIAVLDGYENSDEEAKYYDESILRIPVPELKYAGGSDKNEFILTNRIEGVTIYYTLGYNSSLDDEANRIEFDGKQFKIEDGEYLKAYAVKDKLGDSDPLSRYVYLSEYVTPAPSSYDRKTEGEDHEWYSDRTEWMSLSVPEGKAYYRILSGKQTFDPTEQIDKTKWTEYKIDESNDGWINLGGANSGNQTVQVFAESDDKAQSPVTDIYVDWVRAKSPKVDYNNYQLKLSTDVPGGVIKYVYNYSGIDSVYTAEKFPNGINVKDQWVVEAYVEAEGYQTSSYVSIYRDNYNLSRPEISYKEDGILHITHDDTDDKLELVIETDPQGQSPVRIENNHYTLDPLPNTTVRAFARKYGMNNSEVYEKTPLDRPTIYINDYNVNIGWGYSGDIYYTLDGSQPTEKSTLYEGSFNVDKACTVRAMAYYPGEIPSEAEPAYVIDQAATPEIIFNYSVQNSDEGKVISKKVKFNCVTEDAKIYYSFSSSLSEASRKLYDPSVDWDGIDVGDHEYIYAYAEGDNYRRSETTSRYLGEAYLNSPDISVNNGVVIISHYDPSVTIVPEFTPSQDYTYVHDAETNEIRCNVAYNTVVKAKAQKEGYIPSDQVTLNPLDKPLINVDGYYVYIDGHGWEVYYTTDGSTPTKLSIPYTDPFESKACTIRAVVFWDGFIPSEADPVRVLDQAAMPEIEIEDGFAKLTSTTPGAKIWFSRDVGIGEGTKELYDPAQYPKGIDISEVNVIRSYAEANDFRRSETLVFNKDAYTLSAPWISYSDGYVIAEHDDDEVSIRFTDHNGNVLEAETNDPRKVKVGYNTTVNALAFRKGYVASRSVQVKHTDAPTITADLFKITIKGKSGQTLRYTTDGSLPTASSTEYTEPFYVTASCQVRAAAFVDELVPSEATAQMITYRKSLKPEVKSYDGRHLTLSAENGSSIRYVIGEGADLAQGTVADGSIDLQGLSLVKAIAQRSDADDSDVFTFTPEYYANETDAYMSKPGAMSKAFGWCTDLKAINSLKVHGVMTGDSEEATADYEFLKSLTGLRHLDLTDVTDTKLPDGAFESMKLVSVGLPTSLKEAGTSIFGSDNSTLCAVELSGDGFAPVNILEGVTNPNLLLYVKSRNLVSDLIAQAPEVAKNIVVLGSANSNSRAESVTLSHANAFYAPKEFNAQKISFKRAFTKETSINGFGSGWETMVVPFDVQSIASGNKTLKPFGDADTNKGECPFWLFKPADTDWMTDISIVANTPYLIAMPNNPLYADEFIVNGDVTFSSNNVTVPVTPEEEEMTYSFGTGKYISGNYALIDKEENVLAINNETYNYHNNDFLPGGIFITKERDVVPFECYVSSVGVQALPVFDQSEIEEIIGEYGVSVWSESYDIYIRSSITMKVRIYDTVGQLVRSVDVKAGETVRVQDITPGIYFVGTTKILVKKG